VQRVVHVLVDVERGQHQHARPGLGADARGGADAVEPGHADIHQDHIRAQRQGRADGLFAVAGLPDHGHVGLGVQDHAEAVAHERLVVDDEHADRVSHAPAPAASR
jgi:hypothetical protein